MVELSEAVGAENFFLFGLTADEVRGRRSRGCDPMASYHEDGELRETIDLIGSGFLSKGGPGLFRPLVDSLLRGDAYMVLADYQSYLESQEQVGSAFHDLPDWTRTSVLTVARMGHFFSHRSIREYREKIWNLNPTSIRL